jgi:glycine/D-amino acid oxidase-like deaminating enzyme
VEQVVAGVAASIFTLIPAAEGRAAIGSTFMPEEEDPAPWAGPLRRGGQRFVPGLERAKVVGARTCARPQSFDGRPLVGELPEQQGVWLAAGHGPWGISTGPGTAQLVTDALLGRAEIPAALSAGRF